jgi:hypothetical protein
VTPLREGWGVLFALREALGASVFVAVAAVCFYRTATEQFDLTTLLVGIAAAGLAIILGRKAIRTIWGAR